MRDRWSVSRAAFAGYGSHEHQRYRRAKSRKGKAYAERVARELTAPRRPGGHWADGTLGVTLCDFALTGPGMGPPDDAWEVEEPVITESSSRRRLPRGTRMELTGWGGEQTEGLEVRVWRLLDGPFDGLLTIRTPLGGRYGLYADLVDALIVDPDEPIAHDERRSEALMADLVRMAADDEIAPDPPLPSEVLALLDEARGLPPEGILRLRNVRDARHHSDDAGFRPIPGIEMADVLVAAPTKEYLDVLYRANRSADPDLRELTMLEAEVALEEATAGRGGPVWAWGHQTWWPAEALYTAALGLLAGDLSASEQAALAAWEMVKREATR